MISFKREFHYLFAAVFGWFVLQAVAFFLILRRVTTKLALASFQPLAHLQCDKGAPSGALKASKSSEWRVPEPNIDRLQLEMPCFDVSAVAPLGAACAEALQMRETEGTRQRDTVFQQLFLRDAELRMQVLGDRNTFLNLGTSAKPLAACHI